MTPRIRYSSTRSMNGTIDDHITLRGRFEVRGRVVQLEQTIGRLELERDWMRPAEQFRMGFHLIRAALRNEIARLRAEDDSMAQIHQRYAGKPATRALLEDANQYIALLQHQEKVAGRRAPLADTLRLQLCIDLLQSYRTSIRRQLVGLR